MDGAPSVRLPQVGDVVGGKYRLERLLGQGGMGAVFAARHAELGNAVAIKVMLADPANVEARTRFTNEGRAAAHIESDHVVRVWDVGSESSYAYMVLELLEGEDLAQVLERRIRLPEKEAVDYVLQALEGLQQAHDLRIVHRDLKPSNLFLARKRDGSSVLKILDFGISKAQGAQSALGQTPGSLTSTKAMLGSPLYMSPEQLRSSKNVDARADIWAMGVILYELLTGAPPFGGESLGELFAAILEQTPPPVHERAPGVSPQLSAIVARCLSRSPEHRFASAAELAQALSAVGSGQPVPQGTALLGPPPAFAPPSPGPHPSAPQFPVTPSNPQVPGAITGSGVHGPVVKGTAPLGAITPQPQQTGQWTGAGGGSRSGLYLALGGVAVLAIIGLSLGGYAMTRTKEPAAPSASAALEPPPPPDPLPPPTVSSIATPTTAEPTPPSSPPPPTPKPATHDPRPVAKPAQPPAVAPKPADPPPVAPKPADPPPVAPKPVVTKPAEPKPQGGPIQNSR